MSELPPRPDVGLDQWLAAQRRHMVIDLAATLDLDEAGARSTRGILTAHTRGRPGPAHPNTGAAFSAFYPRFVPNLVTFLVWQGARLPDAADIAQDTMIMAYQRWPQIHQPESWARRVASRALARRLASLAEGLDDHPAEHSFLLPALTSVHTWDQRHEVLRLLDRLEPPQRQVLAWALEGRTAAETAEELEITPDAVRVTLTRARHALAGHLGRGVGQTMSGVASHPHASHLVIDLATTLGLDRAGPREPTAAPRHDDLVADLGDVLDIEAGLSAIVPGAPDTTPPQPTASHHGPLPAEAGAQADSPHASPEVPASVTGELEQLVRAAGSRSPSTRLAMRNHPAFARDLARTHALARDLAGDLARDRARSLTHALTQTLAHDLGLYHERALARALDLDLALALDRALADALDRDRAGDLDRARELDRDLYLALARALDLALDRVHALDHALHRSRARARALARALDRDLDRMIRLVAELHHTLNDVTGADLRSTNLAGIPLNGLRWSPATRWPPQWAERVQRASVPVGDGLYEVQSSDRPPPTTT